MNLASRLFLFLNLMLVIYVVEARFEYTNIKCKSLDETFSNFEYCYLKSVNRTYKYMSLKVNLFKVPITKVKTNIAIVKRGNDNIPFQYNFTVDTCKYLKDTNTFSPVVKYLFGTFMPYTNMEHPCPFNHDLIVDKLPISFLNTQVTDKVPLPAGDYAILTNWFAYNINRADVRVYFTVS